MMMTLAGCGL